MTKYTKFIDKRGKRTIRRATTFRMQDYYVPQDEFEWANNWRKISNLWSWHHYDGLHRATPHPMGKCLKELMREHNQYHADRYKNADMEPPGCYLTEGVLI